MKKSQFLKKELGSPVLEARLKKYPEGDIFQLWGESPELYSKAFGHKDDLHRFIGGHSGLDIVGSHRKPIVASHSGFIGALKTNKTNIGGLVIWLNSDQLEDGNNMVRFTTAYGHLDEILVKVGDWVEKGETMAYMGSTGFVISGGTPYWGDAPAGKGTHLHFSLTEFIWKNNTWQYKSVNSMHNTIDPLPHLTGNWTGTINVLKNARLLLLNWMSKLKGRI